MKTVEIVKIGNGTYVTRRYCGQNKGRAFFFTKTAPATVKKDKKEYVKGQREAMNKYIKDWTGE